MKRAVNILVHDLTPTALSNADGFKLYSVLDKNLKSGNSIIISFNNINVVSSSFLNSSIGNIVDSYGFDSLSNIKLTGYTSSIASFIKQYISDLKSLSYR